MKLCQRKNLREKKKLNLRHDRSYLYIEHTTTVKPVLVSTAKKSSPPLLRRKSQPSFFTSKLFINTVKEDIIKCIPYALLFLLKPEIAKNYSNGVLDFTFHYLANELCKRSRPFNGNHDSQLDKFIQNYRGNYSKETILAMIGYFLQLQEGPMVINKSKKTRTQNFHRQLSLRFSPSQSPFSISSVKPSHRPDSRFLSLRKTKTEEPANVQNIPQQIIDFIHTQFIEMLALPSANSLRIEINAKDAWGDFRIRCFEAYSMLLQSPKSSHESAANTAGL